MKWFKNQLIVCIIVCGLSQSVSAQEAYQSITIPATSLNSSIKHNLPHRQNTEFGTLVIERANILGKVGKDRVAVETYFTFYNPLLEQGIRGSLSLASGIRYDAAHQALYLSRATIQEMRMDDRALSEYLSEEVRGMLDTVIAQVAAKKPIYDLKKIGMKAQLIKKIAIEEGNIVVGMGL